MKANELRIGNWVRKIATSEDTQIFALGIVSHAQCDMANQNWEYQPIPLTPEWLERLGFYCPFVGVYESITRSMDMRFRIHKVSRDLFIIGNYESSARPIQYVHQLQNLYFALTGEELTVTPPIQPHDGK